tara:strand:- start:114 stop:578 length:465 start_codon:yes stop_codon:yes gene_type:complete
MSSVEFEDNIENLYLINLGGIIVLLLWSFLLTEELIKIIPKDFNLKTNFYYFNAIICFATITAITIIYEGEETEFSGIYALIGFYIFYAFLQSFGFAGRIIKSMELNRNSKKRESIGYFFLFIFLPIGIWFLQPKINKLNKNRTEEKTPTANTV